MGKFASPAKQAASVLKALQGDKIQSVGSVRNYEEALKQVAEYAKNELHCSLRDMTPSQAIQYLEYRGQDHGQSSLNMSRQALQHMMQSITHQLAPNEKLPTITSERDEALNSRAYSSEHLKMVMDCQRENNAFSTAISEAAGLRAHELFTIRPLAERAPSDRPALETKFLGREGHAYTVHGKGGLIREIRLPNELAERLEEKRLPEPRTITDRGVNYQQFYDLNGGNRWSSSFSTASNRALGWSTGAHGVRHSYAQSRMRELQVSHGLDRHTALETVSQEMGHFRPSITEVYLR
jgi:integrase